MSQDHINTKETLTPRQFTLLIVESVAARHGVSAADILRPDSMRAGDRFPTRTRKVVEARHEAMAEVAEARPHWSYPCLGNLFGGRDHTTVMSALKKLGRYKPRKSSTNHASGVPAVRAIAAGIAGMGGDQ